MHAWSAGPACQNWLAYSLPFPLPLLGDLPNQNKQMGMQKPCGPAAVSLVIQKQKQK